jgi:hypothetical protein
MVPYLLDSHIFTFRTAFTLYSHHTPSFTNSDVCTKYQEAARIVNLVLQGLVEQCKPGAKILDLCHFGHSVIEASTQKLFTKKVNGRTIERGVAFPVCISVNDCICNYSPLKEEERVSSIASIASLRPDGKGTYYMVPPRTRPVHLYSIQTCWVIPSAPRLWASLFGVEETPPKQERAYLDWITDHMD